MAFLDDVRVVTIALNLPGPAACSRLREMGAGVAKVEPPGGDPLEAYVPAWYRELHAGIEVLRLDLKSPGGRERLEGMLSAADLLVTAQRPSALARLGLDREGLARRHPRLCVVRIVGHGPPHEERSGHDLTYMAVHGLVSPPALPPTLFADMAGAERVASTALALLHARGSGQLAPHCDVALDDAARWLALPRHHGLTAPGTLLGGAHAGYNLYAASDGWIAVAALEPHFARRLAEALDVASLDAAALAARFARETASHWERWASERDIPIAAVRLPPTHAPS
jgi:crotonobetainyl-CoA:carnitine CoA-transferase CaiB-like acyl-CoA transferase